MPSPAAGTHAQGRDHVDVYGAWSSACARHVTHVTARASRTQSLHNQWLVRVSRGDISAGTLREWWSAFAHAHGRDYARRVNASTARFLTALARTGRARGVSDLREPFFHPDQPLAWLQPIAEASADLLRDLAEIGSEYQDEYLLGALSAADASTSGAAGSLVLRAPPGDTASASFSVVNERLDPAAVRCAIAWVRRANGVGAAFDPHAMIDPDPIVLDPDEGATVRVSLRLDPSLYEPGVAYVGVLQVIRPGVPHVEVPVHISAAVRADAGRPGRATR